MKAPDGTPITGTSDSLLAEAFVNEDLEHIGESEISWDSQETITLGGQRVFIDQDGYEWLESQLIPDDAEPLPPDQIEPWYLDRDLRRVEIVNTVEALMLRITGTEIKVASCQFLQRAVTLLLNRSEPEDSA